MHDVSNSSGQAEGTRMTVLAWIVFYAICSILVTAIWAGYAESKRREEERRQDQLDRVWRRHNRNGDAP